MQERLVESGMKLIHELKVIFTKMALGKKKYLDPSSVIDAVLDD